MASGRLAGRGTLWTCLPGSRACPADRRRPDKSTAFERDATPNERRRHADSPGRWLHTLSPVFLVGRRGQAPGIGLRLSAAIWPENPRRSLTGEIDEPRIPHRLVQGAEHMDGGLRAHREAW